MRKLGVRLELNRAEEIEGLPIDGGRVTCQLNVSTDIVNESHCWVDKWLVGYIVPIGTGNVLPDPILDRISVAPECQGRYCHLYDSDPRLADPEVESIQLDPNEPLLPYETRRRARRIVKVSLGRELRGHMTAAVYLTDGDAVRWYALKVSLARRGIYSYDVGVSYQLTKLVGRQKVEVGFD